MVHGIYTLDLIEEDAQCCRHPAFEVNGTSKAVVYTEMRLGSEL